MLHTGIQCEYLPQELGFGSGMTCKRRLAVWNEAGIRIRLPDGELTEIPWIRCDHIHRPFDERTWQRIRSLTLHGNHGEAEQYEADLADALYQLVRHVHNGHAIKSEQALPARTAHVPPA